MNNLNNNQMPCVVSTPQGISVSYKNRFLYSKYNPSKTILQTIDSLELMEGTVVLCFSPVLCTGLKELIKKLPEHSFIVLCEFDEKLQNFALSSSLLAELTEEEKKHIYFPSVSSLYDLPQFIYNLSKEGEYRRIKRIDFSSGVQFQSELYRQLEDACVNSIKTFWTNRLTLTKFGRKYSYNLFRNLKKIGNTTPLQSFIQKIDKPILVFGAGESTDYVIKNYKSIMNNFYILCVDTALSPLIKSGIMPNGVFVEEAQTVISKAFICNKYNVQLFAGLSSLPSLKEYFKDENISYFTTEYVDSSFFNNLKIQSLLPPVNPPFGSVGLTSVYYALSFRKNTDVPVFLTGLDFSYSIGKTHCKGAIAHVGRLLSTNRLTSIDNLNAAFLGNATPFWDKEKNIFITTPSLSNYASLFNNLFSKEINLFDVSNSGLPLSIPRIKLEKYIFTNNRKSEINKESFSEEYKEQVSSYFEREEKALKRLKSLLTEKQDCSNEELEKEIKDKIQNREYLYLHYPDGYKFIYNQSFLNRIRTEIDFFLKIF